MHGVLFELSQFKERRLSEIYVAYNLWNFHVHIVKLLITPIAGGLFCVCVCDLSLLIVSVTFGCVRSADYKFLQE